MNPTKLATSSDSCLCISVQRMWKEFHSLEMLVHVCAFCNLFVLFFRAQVKEKQEAETDKQQVVQTYQIVHSTVQLVLKTSLVAASHQVRLVRAARRVRPPTRRTNLRLELKLEQDLVSVCSFTEKSIC